MARPHLFNADFPLLLMTAEHVRSPSTAFLMFQPEPTEQGWLLFPCYDSWNFRLQAELSCQSEEPGYRTVRCLGSLQQSLCQFHL